MKKTYIVLLFFIIPKCLFAMKRKPIEIIADSMEWNKQLGQAIAVGNAKAFKVKLL